MVSAKREAGTRVFAEPPVRLLLTAVALIGAVGIAFEIVLVRILSIAQWHHFAYMIISLALLGFAVAGTVLGIARAKIRGREAFWFRAAALALPLGLVASYELSHRIPFETLQLATQPKQGPMLLALYAALAVPFAIVSGCIALAFLLRPTSVARVYSANLLGSGLGAAGVVAALFVVPTSAVPLVLAAMSLAAFLLVSFDRPRWIAAGVAVGMALAATSGLEPSPIRISEYKGLSYAMRLPGARIVAERESPHSRLTAVRSPLLRETPGQVAGYSFRQAGPLPEQVGLYFDAGSVSPAHRFDGSFAPFRFLDHVTSALVYQLTEEPYVLVIGAGGGTEVLAGLAHGARHVTAVELDPGVRELMLGPLAAFTGDLYRRPDVELVLAEGRGFLQSRRQALFDVIQISLIDSFVASAAGVHALSESHLYTTEAVALYLRHLEPDGVLSITRWLKSPPRDAIKLFATVVAGCRAAGLEEPGEHIAFIRSWNTGTIVVSRSPLSETRLAAIRGFSDRRGFDRAYHPGLTEDEVNRYTVLERPVYYRSALRLLSADPESFLREYPFYVRPATDDRPHFFRFFRWRSLPAILGAGRDWVNYVEWGYLVLVATLAQAVIAALALVLLPLWITTRRAAMSGPRIRLTGYFGGLGLAFMFLEIGFIQKLMLFLNRPVYAVSVVLAAFLVFSGLGSLLAGRTRRDRIRLIRLAVLAIAVISMAYLVALPPLFAQAAGWPDAAKVGMSLLLLAPLAVPMGIPFPCGLQAVAERAERLVPWAWGINGAASVVGAGGATLVAVHAGFGVVVVVALAFYGGSVLAFRALASV
jgi:spermidine synthase